MVGIYLEIEDQAKESKIFILISDITLIELNSSITLVGDLELLYTLNCPDNVTAE